MKVHIVPRWSGTDETPLYTEEDECTFRSYINYEFIDNNIQPFDIVVPEGSTTLQNGLIRSACGNYWDESSHDNADDKICYGTFTIMHVLYKELDGAAFFQDYADNPHVIIELTNDIYYVCKEKAYKKYNRDANRVTCVSKQQALEERARLLGR